MDDPLAKFKQEIAMSELEMIENDEIEKSLKNGSAENNNFTADMLGGASRFPKTALFSSINANVTNVTQKVYSNLDKLRKKSDNPGTNK